MLNARDFGALGDGQTDETTALQRALDAAAKSGETVYLPAGVYPCSTLRLAPHVGLCGDPTWSFREFGGAVLRLNDRAACCLIDATDAFGATLNGLCLDGADNLGEGVHGVLTDPPAYPAQENVLRIERCKIAHFSGDGVFLNRIFCFTLRHSMFAHNGGHGAHIRGWDGFILDNWFSGNRGAGWGAEEESASITMTGNRIEWNKLGGVVLRGATHYNLTGNYIDRSRCAGISIRPGREGGIENGVFTITGNVIYRSGAPHGTPPEDLDSSQVRFEEVSGLVFTGNTLRAGQDDGGQGDFSPQHAIVLRALKNSVIKDNVLDGAALQDLLVDLAGHGEGVIIQDNPGSLLVPS